MKRIEKSILMVVCLFAPFLSPLSQAQEATSDGIFEALSAWQPGAGVVIIDQSPAIRALVGQKRYDALANAKMVNGLAVLSGYRIQAYSGNLKNSKSIATERQNQIQALYPELLPTVEYDAPFWRVRVGNFVEQSEAQAKMEELQKSFPSFAREMYVIRAQVRIDPQDL